MEIDMATKINFRDMKRFSLRLLDWHGGGGSGVYQVGSCLLSMADRGRLEDDTVSALIRQESFQLAERELRDVQEKRVRYPEAVTPTVIRDVSKVRVHLGIWKHRIETAWKEQHGDV